MVTYPKKSKSVCQKLKIIVLSCAWQCDSNSPHTESNQPKKMLVCAYVCACA